MRRLFDLVREMPSTNVRLFVGICLAVVYVAWVMIAGTMEGVSGWDVLPDSDYVDQLGMFVLILVGIDTAQFAVKRATQRKPNGELVHEVTTERTVESRKTGEAS